LLVFALRHQRLVRTRSAGIDRASLVPRSAFEQTVGLRGSSKRPRRPTV